MSHFFTRFAGEGIGARVLRASSITVAGFVVTQSIRLGSNLILTRLLFPEAFGIMAMIMVFLVGLAMFSDLGLGQSIMGSPRGDDPDFLDTAWTLQILRGAILSLAAMALAWPAAVYYDEPQLLAFLPVAALTLLISGFNPTRLESASRHLRAGSITLIEIGSQVVGVAVAVTLAWLTHSVWALVASNLAAAFTTLVALNLFLPGPTNRLRWEPTAARELIHFGKWIFLSTFMAFAINQADKVILGRVLSLGTFGLYNISSFLAAVPALMGGLVMRRVLIPVYRQSPPSASQENFLRVRRLRAYGTAAMMALVILLAVTGGWLVDVLYDPRYHVAGGMVVLMSVMQIPALLIATCEHAALAEGDSRRYFVFTAIRAVCVCGAILGGWHLGGLAGALIGQGVGNLLAYPALAWLLAPHRAWDWRLDASLGLFGFGLGLAAIHFNAEVVGMMAALAN